MSNNNQLVLNLQPSSSPVLYSSPLKKNEVVNAGLMHLNNLEPTGKEQHFSHFDIRPRTRLDCAVFKFDKIDDYRKWLKERQQTLFWVCRHK